MAKFTFQFETDEYSEYRKAACSFEALFLLNKIVQDLDDLRTEHSLTSGVSSNLHKITAKIDNFLNTLE